MVNPKIVLWLFFVYYIKLICRCFLCGNKYAFILFYLFIRSPWNWHRHPPLQPAQHMFLYWLIIYWRGSGLPGTGHSICCPPRHLRNMCFLIDWLILSLLALAFSASRGNLRNMCWSINWLNDSVIASPSFQHVFVNWLIGSVNASLSICCQPRRPPQHMFLNWLIDSVNVGPCTHCPNGNLCNTCLLIDWLILLLPALAFAANHGNMCNTPFMGW
jgi:hypothetical protein